MTIGPFPKQEARLGVIVVDWIVIAMKYSLLIGTTFSFRFHIEHYWLGAGGSLHYFQKQVYCSGGRCV